MIYITILKRALAGFTGAVIIAAAVVCSSGAASNAASSAELKAQIEEAIAKRDTAHELAEAARTLGADDSHYTIWFAKQEWNRYAGTVEELTAQYNAAVATEKKEQEKGNYIGNFRISYYCSCSVCNGSYGATTATGASMNPGTTIAVDPSVIPLGSRVYIEGVGWRVAQDTGGAIKGNRIDVLVGSHSEAYAKGIDYCAVYVK